MSGHNPYPGKWTQKQAQIMFDALEEIAWLAEHDVGGIWRVLHELGFSRPERPRQPPAPPKPLKRLVDDPARQARIQRDWFTPLNKTSKKKKGGA